MKKLLGLVLLILSFMQSGPAQAKLSDRQSMKCIDGDKLTRSIFSDLQAAYEMRFVSAKDFLKVMESPTDCPQLKKDLKKLHASAIAAFPQNKLTPRTGSPAQGRSESRHENYGGYGNTYNPPPVPNYDEMPSPPDFDMSIPPMDFPEQDFDEGFGDF